jgi:flagellar motility protein MotE (MotC chaperone)
MADKDKPEEETTKKKKGFFSGSKIPLDAVLLVVVPFGTFMALFMYLMGLIPPQPMTVNYLGPAPTEQAPEPAASSPVASPGTEPREVAPGPTTRTEITPQEVVGPFPAEAMEAGAVDADEKDLTETSATEGALDAAGEVEGTQGESAGEAAEIDQERMDRIKQLAKVYEQMNASSVAAIVTTMDEDEAVAILANMNPRNAAKVLASLAPERAARLSLMLTE